MLADEAGTELQIAARGGTIGADVRGVNFALPFSAALVAQLHAALARHEVLFFAGQHITSAQ